MIQASWERNRNDFTEFFNYPKDIRKAIYTTNAIESLNFSLRLTTDTSTCSPKRAFTPSVNGIPF